MEMWWPIILAVVSDVAYQIASKSVPAETNPFASLTLAYLVGSIASVIIFFLTSGGESLGHAFRSGNWTTLVLGLCFVGLEAGSVYMFRAGWDVSVGPLVKGAIIALALLVVGHFAFHEPIGLSKLAGTGAILAGLYLINR